MKDKFSIIRNAERFVVAQQYDRAIGAYQELLEQFGEDPSVLNTLGDLLLRGGRREEALACFHRVAEVFSQTGFSGKAAAIYRKIDQLIPDDPDVLRNLAELYRKRGLRFESIRHLKQLLSVRIDRSEKDAALQVLQELLDETGEDPGLLKVKADLLMEERPQEAANLLAQAARLYADQDHREDAEACVSAALRLNPGQLLARSVAAELDIQLPFEAVVEPAGDRPSAEEPQLVERASADTAYGVIALGSNRAENEAEALDWEGLFETAEPAQAAAGPGDLEIATESVPIPAGEPAAADTVTPGTDEWQDFGLLQPQELAEEPTAGMVPEPTQLESDAEPASIPSTEPAVPKSVMPEAEEWQETGIVEPQVTTAEPGDKAADELVEAVETLEQPTEEILPAPGEAPLEPLGVVEPAEATEPLEAAAETGEPALEQGEVVEAPSTEPAVAELELPAATASLPSAEEAFTAGGPELAEALEEVAFYQKLNLHDDATRLVRRLLEQYPEDSEVKAQAARLGLIQEPPPEPSFVEEIDGVLEDLFFEEPESAIAEEQRTDRESSVIADSSNDAARSQFDLGLAYREMGMVEDAAEKFEQAYHLFVVNQDIAQATECCRILCMTFLKSGDFRRTVEWADIGLSLPTSRPEDWRRLEYDRAVSLEQLGEIEECLAGYRRILGNDPEYLDVRARVTALESLPN